jgi:uncharacterized glyoxalase superfamily protein PhnB
MVNDNVNYMPPPPSGGERQAHVKPSPNGWPRISSSLFYEDPRAAIDWLGRAFGLEPRLVVEGDGGEIVHSELTLGDGVVMVGAAGKAPWTRSPRSQGGGNTQALFAYVDDLEAHCARARAAGAAIATEPRTSDYGDEYWSDRSYEAVDCEGHHWWFAERLATGTKPRQGGAWVKEKG